MKNNLPKIWLLILAVAVLAIATADIWFWYLISGANEESSYLRGDIELQVKRNSVAGDLEKLIKDTEAERQQIDSYFVGVDQTVNFVEYLESLARVAGVNFEITSLGVEQSKDDFKDQIILRGEAAGSWSGLMNFASLLENAPYRLDLADFVINNNEGKRTWEMAVLIKAFQLKK